MPKLTEDWESSANRTPSFWNKQEIECNSVFTSWQPVDGFKFLVWQLLTKWKMKTVQTIIGVISWGMEWIEGAEATSRSPTEEGTKYRNNTAATTSTRAVIQQQSQSSAAVDRKHQASRSDKGEVVCYWNFWPENNDCKSEDSITTFLSIWRTNDSVTLRCSALKTISTNASY